MDNKNCSLFNPMGSLTQGQHLQESGRRIESVIITVDINLETQITKKLVSDTYSVAVF